MKKIFVLMMASTFLSGCATIYHGDELVSLVKLPESDISDKEILNIVKTKIKAFYKDVKLPYGRATQIDFLHEYKLSRENKKTAHVRKVLLIDGDFDVGTCKQSVIIATGKVNLGISFQCFVVSNEFIDVGIGYGDLVISGGKVNLRIALGITAYAHEATSLKERSLLILNPLEEELHSGSYGLKIKPLFHSVTQQE